MKNVLVAILLAVSAVTAYGQKVMTLQECRRLSMEHNAEVRNAALDVTAARLQKQEALAEYFPKVEVAGGAFHAKDPLFTITIADVLGNSPLACNISELASDLLRDYGLNSSFSTLNYGYAGTVNLTQPIFAGGRIVTGNKLAALGERAAVAKSELQNRTAAEQVDKDFYGILALQEKQITLSGLQRLLDTLQKDVEAAYAAGLALNTDVSEVMLKQSELKAGQSKLKMGLRLAKMNMLNSLGVEYNPYVSIDNPDKPSIDSFTFEGSFDQLMTPQEAYVDEEKASSSLAENRLLQMQVEARNLERRMVLGEALPTLGLGATYGYAKGVTNPRWNGALYALLKIPITDWGKNSRKLQRMRLEIQKAENQRDYLSSQLVLQLRMLFVELNCAWDNVQIAVEAEALAKDRMDNLTVDYTVGNATLTELLRSQTAYRDAQEFRIDTTLDYLSSLEAYRLRCGAE
ncbi:MAG: TolC family protein [Bacteroidales bacterium]|nr:TolC family protein [Bacteroidales bacterium]